MSSTDHNTSHAPPSDQTEVDDNDRLQEQGAGALVAQLEVMKRDADDSQPPPDTSDDGVGGDSAVPAVATSEFVLRDVNGTVLLSAPAVDGWDGPTAGPWDALSAPTMSSDLLPPRLRDYAIDVAERVPVQLEMVGLPLLAVTGSIIGTQLGIRPRRLDNWTEVPVFWSLLVADVGECKTAGIQAALSPLRTMEQETRDLMCDQLLRAEVERDAVQLKVKKKRKELDEAIEGGEGKAEATIQGQLADLLRQERSLTTEPPCFITSDATVEAVSSLLQKNPRGILLFRDELFGFINSMDAYRKGGGDREFYLEAANGTHPFTVDRKGGGRTFIKHLAVSVLGTTQPAKFGKLLQGASGGGQEADGFLQRFALLAYPDRPTSWSPVDRLPNADAREETTKVMRLLDHLDTQEIGATAHEEDAGIPYFRFDKEGQEIFTAWERELHHRRIHEEMPAAFGAHISKYPGLFARLALTCHAIESAGREEAWEPISGEAATMARSLIDFLDHHARKAYQVAAPERQEAGHLLAKVVGGDIVDGCAIPDLYRPQWSGLKTKAAVERGLRELQRMGWVREEKQPTTTKSRRVLRLHPALCKLSH